MDEPLVIEVMCLEGHLRTISVSCRCGEKFTAKFPEELATAQYMAPAFACSCGQRYSFKSGVLIRLGTDNKAEKLIVAKDSGDSETQPSAESFLQPPSRSVN